MCYNKVETWRIIYAWTAYVVPHFRYGALIFMNHPETGKSPNYVYKHRRLYYQSIKTALQLSSRTPDRTLRNLLGPWDHSNLVNQSFVGSANAWLKSIGQYAEQIQGGDERILTQYGNLNKGLGRRVPQFIHKQDLSNGVIRDTTEF
jgi:hypothetical protein